MSNLLIDFSNNSSENSSLDSSDRFQFRFSSDLEAELEYDNVSESVLRFNKRNLNKKSEVSKQFIDNKFFLIC